VPPAVVVVVWFALAWLPGTLSGHEARQEEAEGERVLLLADLAKARALPNQVADLEARLAETDVAVPETVELAEFLRAASAAGDRAGIEIEHTAPLTVSSDADQEDAATLPAGTSSVSISIGARGGYDQVVAFADELRALDRLVVIDLMDLTTDEEDTNTLILDVELRIFTTEELTTVSDLGDEFLEEDFDQEDDLIEGAWAGVDQGEGI
jgi:Tfp pilus assembly protein PilO